MSEETQATEVRNTARWGRWLVFAIVLAVLVGIGVALVRLIPVTHRYYTDADMIRTPAETAPTRDILWQPPKKLAELINTTADDYEPRLSADGLTLFFVRGKAGENADIYISRHTHEGWTEPKPLVGVNSEYEELGPEPSPDGQSLYFYSDRPGGLGGYDLWVAHHGRQGWQSAINLGPLVNSEFNDYGPALSDDGTTLYFSSNRPQPGDETEPDPNAWPATIREDLFHRDYDLYWAAVTDRGFGKAKAIASLNSPYNEGAPAVSSFGDFLYFASDRPGGAGGFDLYRSRRLRGEHQPPDSAGPAINTEANELDPGLTMGGYGLYFASDRQDDQAAPEAPRKYDLYYTTSREVFTEVDRVQRPPIDWAGLWRQIGPNLLWALLALLLLLLFLALLRDVRGRRLSLLAKCLLASLMAHLLLMLLFNVWEVTASLAREFRRSGRIQITLTSPAKGDALARQIRGQFTQIETPAPLETPRQRHAASTEVETVAATVALTVERGVMDVQDEPATDLTAVDAAVEQRSQRPEMPEEILESYAPMTVEMALPTGQARVAATEPEASMQSSPVQTEPPQRPSVAVDTSRPVDASVELTRIPPSFETNDVPPDADSIAGVLTMREADPPLSVVTETVQTPEMVDYPTLTDLSLPETPIERVPETTESTLQITAQPTTSPRHELPDTTLSLPSADSPFHIAPEATSAAPNEATFADRPLPQDVDVSVSPAPPDAAYAGRYDPALPPLTDLALPNPQATVAAATTESMAEPAVQSMTPPRRQASANVTSEVVPATLVSVDPRRVDPAPDESLVRGGLDRLPPDTTPSRAPRDEAIASTAEASELPAADLALPRLEQPNTQRQTEVAPQATWLASKTLRASPAEPMMSSEDALSPAIFDVPSSWRHDTEEAPDDLPQLALNDYDLELSDRKSAPLTLTARELAVPDTPALGLSLPTEVVPPANPYVQRSAPDRLSIVERMGGSEETERAVADALAWLARHQSDDGHWDGKGFDEQCGECGGETDIVVDHALTGLALLSFYGAGHTHLSDGSYKENVERGLQWLIDRQRPDGDLRGDETMYTQGIVTIALSEAYGMTGDASLAQPVRLAVRFIDRARNTSVGGWRYDPGQVGDTSVLGWQVMALKSASINGIATPAASFKAAREWLDLVSNSSRPGLYAYQPRRRYTPAMTAEGMFTQQLLGLRREDPRMQTSAEFVSQNPPDWEARPNTYYWYYATLALFQHQGELWHNWNEELTGQLLSHQRKDGAAAGSWDPDGEWADIGGRIYQTALCALMLEVYYRYLPLYSLDGVTDSIGAIRGVVSDASTGTALPGATVRLVLPDRSPISIDTGADGGYTLTAPQVPDFFALSASKEGYVPSTANVDSAMVQGTTLAVDFQLLPEDLALVAVEAVPDVHHLGDDNFDGTINSQFQKKSEGAVFAAEFELNDTQLPPYFNNVELRLLAKGVQRSHKIRINGTVLDRRLDDAPSDGSFGEFVAAFDASILRAGANTLEVIARPSSNDIDDFEFVNIQLHLAP